MITAPNAKTYQQSHIKSEGGNPLTKYVNLCQTPEERRDKYAHARFFGLSRNQAERMRDWHWSKITQAIDAFLHPYQLPLPTPAHDG
jgi:hypothetical protein